MEITNEEVQFLREALEHTLQCYIRSLRHIGELKATAENHRGSMSPATYDVIETFLDRAKGANETSFSILNTLAKEVDLKPLLKAAQSGLADPSGNLADKVQTGTAAVMAWREYGLYIANTFLASATLNDVLSMLAEKPDPTNTEIAQEMAFAGIDYLKGLGKRLLLVEEVEELIELLKELEKAGEKLSKDKMTITLERLSVLDRAIQDFTAASEKVGAVDGKLKNIAQSIEEFVATLPN